MKYITLTLCILLLITQQLKGQGQSEGITYSPEKKYFIISYCCAEDSSIHQGVYIPGDLVSPNVNASTIFSKSDNLYTYIYDIANEDEASRLLYSFSVDLLTDVTNLKNPNKSWESNVIGWKSIVKWHFSRGDIKGIKPGSEEAGFSFQSNELPSIIYAYASSNTFKGFPDDGPTSAKLQAQLDSLENVTQHIRLKTIGPRKLPENISHTALLDTLRSYLDFSCANGWVTNRGICRSLEAKLENVDRQLGRDKTKQAVNGLRAFLNEVEAQKGTHITSEGYALLYYNAAWLKEQLEQSGN